MVQISFPVTRIRSLKQGGQTKKGIIIHLIVSMTNTPTSRFHQSPLKEGKRSSRLSVTKLIVENVPDRNEIFLRRKTKEFPCPPSSTTILSDFLPASFEAGSTFSSPFRPLSDMNSHAKNAVETKMEAHTPRMTV